MQSQLADRKFWESFAPGFHIADDAFCRGIETRSCELNRCEELSALLKEEGYFQETADWGLDLAAMAQIVRALSDANLSPVFAFLYDEYWVPFFKLHSILSELLGGQYFLLPDFWIWNVDPKRGDAGWRPHRDRGKTSLLDDGAPKSLTAWIPLSKATPLNGCLYIVPIQQDPTYGTEEENTWKFEHAGIRALPAEPGDFLVWNQAVLHWGSKTSQRAAESRVSMALEFQRADTAPFNQPLIEPLRVLTFKQRLRLIAKQILQYRHMNEIDLGDAIVAWRLLSATADDHE